MREQIIVTDEEPLPGANFRGREARDLRQLWQRRQIQRARADIEAARDQFFQRDRRKAIVGRNESQYRRVGDGAFQHRQAGVQLLPDDRAVMRDELVEGMATAVQADLDQARGRFLIEEGAELAVF